MCTPLGLFSETAQMNACCNEMLKSWRLFIVEAFPLGLECMEVVAMSCLVGEKTRQQRQTKHRSSKTPIRADKRGDKKERKKDRKKEIENQSLVQRDVTGPQGG